MRNDYNGTIVATSSDSSIIEILQIYSATLSSTTTTETYYVQTWARYIAGTATITISLTDDANGNYTTPPSLVYKVKNLALLEGTLTLSTSEVTLSTGESTSVTAETNYSGTLTVGSYSKKIATATVNGNTITITAGSKTGTTYIEVTLSDDPNGKYQTPYRKTIKVTVE
jgi:hypothetical protein